MESHRDPSKENEKTDLDLTTNVPEEVWLNVLNHLTPVQRSAAAPTCQLFNRLANDTKYWEKACREAGIKAPPNTDPEKFKLLFANDWKEKHLFTIRADYFYYVIGNRVDSSRPRTIKRPENTWGHTLFGPIKDGFSYQELVNTIPKGNALIFKNNNEAHEAAFRRRDFKQGKTYLPVVISLTFEKDFFLPLETETFIAKKDTWDHPLRPKAAKVDHGTIDLNNPELTGPIYIQMVEINGVGLSTPHYLHGNALQQAANKCLVM